MPCRVKDRTPQTKSEWVQQRPLVVLGTKQPKKKHPSLRLCPCAGLYHSGSHTGAILGGHKVYTDTPPHSLLGMGHWTHKGKVTWPKTLRISLEVGGWVHNLIAEVAESPAAELLCIRSISSVLRASGELTEAGDESHSGFCQM